MPDVPAPLPTRRADLMARLATNTVYDIAVVGGGATGLGIALDAAARGLRVVLFESHDFAKGTSSRATKLLHGGVRYLAQGNLGLVYEALHERTTLLHNAPHLTQPLAFVVPSYRWWETPFYGAGLKLYDLLAGDAGLGRTEILNRAEVQSLVPGVQQHALRGGVKYWDGQFDDARLALALARTAARHGALVLNYCKATQLHYTEGKISGLTCEDSLNGQPYRVTSRCVINATGVWVDALREQDGAANSHDGRHPTLPMVAPSQGVHIVVNRDFLGGDTALMVPKTADGRVLFAVPWLGKVILGTTDTPRHDLAREPLPFADEVRFILSEAGRYLRAVPTLADIQSIWVGLRPLVKPQDDDGEGTKSLSREHTVRISRSNLVTVTGGKWTTYRAMAEDVLKKCQHKQLIPASSDCSTRNHKLVGANPHASTSDRKSHSTGLEEYGLEASYVQKLPGADHRICSNLTEAMVRFAARHEYAITVEDVLARRSRLLFLDARLAGHVARWVGDLMEQETGVDSQYEAFQNLVRQYLHVPI